MRRAKSVPKMPGARKFPASPVTGVISGRDAGVVPGSLASSSTAASRLAPSPSSYSTSTHEMKAGATASRGTSRWVSTSPRVPETPEKGSRGVIWHGPAGGRVGSLQALAGSPGSGRQISAAGSGWLFHDCAPGRKVRSGGPGLPRRRIGLPRASSGVTRGQDPTCNVPHWWKDSTTAPRSPSGSDGLARVGTRGPASTETSRTSSAVTAKTLAAEWPRDSLIPQVSAKTGPLDVGGAPHPPECLVIVARQKPAEPPVKLGTNLTLASGLSPGDIPAGRTCRRAFAVHWRGERR